MRSLKKFFLILFVVLISPNFSFSQPFNALEDEEGVLEDASTSQKLEVPEQYQKEDNGFLDRLFGGSANYEDDNIIKDSLKTSPIEGANEEIEIIEEAGEGDFQNTAVIAVIDKNLGKKYLPEIKVGSEHRIRKISIKPLSCWKPKDITLLNESKALVEVNKYDQDYERGTKIYNGWILARNSAASLLEDEEYDIILINCKNK